MSHRLKASLEEIQEEREREREREKERKREDLPFGLNVVAIAFSV